ncbi:MAG TPA: MFS transporter [Mycobacteriales bacterium]|jgi:MFS family permease|nr:MFS transporter [Mycobacteriales bacterium]
MAEAPSETVEAPQARPSRWRRIAADTTPLRESADYRRWWFGYSLSFTGTQLTQFAIPLQVYAITRSSLYVGLVGLVVVVPLVVMGLFGGAIADAVDRRRLTLVTGTALMVLSTVLAVLAAAGVQRLSLLYVIAGVQGAFSATDSSARGAILPRLVRRELLPSANALGQLGFQTGLSAGPLLGGVLVGTLGFAWAYGLDAASFLAVLYAIWKLPAMPPEGGGSRAGVASVLEGLRFLGPRKNLLMTFLVDINAMVFGMPRALFPAIGATWFHGGPGTVGLLAAAPSLGALLGAMTSGWAAHIRRQGLAVLVSVAIWGGSIALFGFTRVLWLALVLLGIAGAADMVSAIFRNTILQVATPDSLRGRLQGVFIVVVTGGPRIGDVEAGSVAAAFGTQLSVVSGGLACVAGVGILAAMFPTFARYDGHDPVP